MSNSLNLLASAAILRAKEEKGPTQQHVTTIVGTGGAGGGGGVGVGVGGGSMNSSGNAGGGTTTSTVMQAAPSNAPSGSSSHAQPVVPASAIGLLPTAKSVNITCVPDWTQRDLKTPHLPVSMCIVFDRPGTLPQHAVFCFEIFVWVVPNPLVKDANGQETSTGPIQKIEGEEEIGKSNRALLWYAPDTWPKYSHAVEINGCRPAADELKCVSVCIRPFEEKLAGSLTYVRRNPANPLMPGYLKLIHKHQYSINITFNAGSRIAQHVAIHQFRPIIYLSVKHPGSSVPIGSRLFTNFITNWGQFTEAAPDEREVQLCREAMALDLKDAELRKAHVAKLEHSKSAPGSGSGGGDSMDLGGQFGGASSLHPIIPMSGSQTGSQFAPQQFAYAKQFDETNRAQTAYTQLHPKAAASAAPGSGGATPGLFAAASNPMVREQTTRGSMSTGMSVGGFDRTTIDKGFATSTNAVSSKAVAAGLQHALEPMATANLNQKSNVPEIKYEHLLLKFSTTPIQSIALPPLIAESQYNPKISFEPSVQKFLGSESMLAQAIALIEAAARTHSLDPKSDATDAAKHMLSTLSAVNQLSGWQHVAAYILQPLAYLERLKQAAQYSGSTGGRSSDGKELARTVMDDFQQRGQIVLKKLVQRIDWFLELARKAGQPFDANLAVRVIAADRDWAHEANVFMREAEAKVTDLLVHNQKSFDDFRKLQRKGVQWPHSPQLRAIIESAGFHYRPMMIKRDRCVCEVCNIEISGWRPWHDPWKYHNYEKHDSTFKEKARAAMQRAGMGPVNSTPAPVAAAAPPASAPPTAAAGGGGGSSSGSGMVIAPRPGGGGGGGGGAPSTGSAASSTTSARMTN